MVEIMDCINSMGDGVGVEGDDIMGVVVIGWDTGNGGERGVVAGVAFFGGNSFSWRSYSRFEELLKK